jgi:hypothetical protein
VLYRPSKGGVPVRAVDCPCGEHLEERNDEKLLEATREHANKDHEGQYQDWELRELVTTSAYDSGT